MAPRGLFVDKKYTLYFYDEFNSQIEKWPIGAKKGFTVISHLPPTIYITSDCYGNISFASNVTNTIYQYDSVFNILKSIINGNNSLQFNSVKLDSFGNLYVIDTQNNQLIKYAILQ